MVKEYSGDRFSGLDLAGEEISGAIFEDCLFEDCRFQEVTIKNCRFSGCHFRRVMLSAIQYKDTDAMGNSFEECSVAGTDWSALLDERKRDMGFLPFDSFSACALRYCVFFGLELKKFNFHSCDLSGSFFDDCDLTSADFSDCELQGTSFSHNNLTGADFRGAVNYLFSLESNKAAKARFSLPEAVNLLSAMGIIIEEN